MVEQLWVVTEIVVGHQVSVSVLHLIVSSLNRLVLTFIVQRGESAGVHKIFLARWLFLRHFIVILPVELYLARL